MAATVSAWSKPGAWALDSEEHEEELLQQNHKDDEPKPLVDFPSLAVAAATKPKKKKAQTYSLAEFTAKPDPAFTNQEDLLNLPTGPRQRSAEELDRDRNHLGGGFRSYGDRPRRNSGGDESSNSRWGSSRVSDEPRRNGAFGARDSNRELPPSRADEIDNWAAAKKSPSGGNGFERKERERGGFFDSQSRADESESWVSNKSFVPSDGRRFGSNGGGGFERERKVGFGSSGGADSDNWNKKKGEFSVGSERSESGSGGRPKLVLQPRKVSASNENQEGGSGNVTKPKGLNPFGEARPREQVLAEKGQDWKKFDEQLESMKIKETNVDGFGKRAFGSGNSSNAGRGASFPDDRTERSWRRPQSDDDRPKSAEKVEDEHVEEN
ncbi:eukaryotic translation initiation factor 4B3 [Abrus precatorius]|uniref:Eukaryotic translation initiation factor 4B3 n=1 Tax=Abrus precatorius TaxID=3816 RepID=A0A8B8LIY8_ABRPR|nr:eukaryotic translation initiation factor 4B3 [Abrus precatorius]